MDNLKKMTNFINFYAINLCKKCLRMLLPLLVLSQ